MGIAVLGPHINESGVFFEVNEQGEIRFGLGAIKGAGDNAVEAMIQERDAKGPYTDIFYFAKRMASRPVNKKTFEVLALSGAFDCFPDYHRRQYIAAKEGDINLIEKAIRYAAKAHQDEMSSQTSLFGGGGGACSPSTCSSTQTPRLTGLVRLGKEVTAKMPTHAAVLRDSDNSNVLPKATNTGAVPRMMG